MIEELEQVVLEEDLPQRGLAAGDSGSVVLVHEGGKGYMVEFMTLGDRTVAVETLTAAQVRGTEANEIAHVRPLAPAS